MYHTGTFNYVSFCGVKSLGVPLFFFANGYLMLKKERRIKTTLEMAIKMILLYFIWGTLKMITYICPMRDICSLDVLHLIKCEQGYGYWFLLTMAILYILYPLARYVVSNERLYKYLVCVLLFGSVTIIEIPFRKIYPFSGWHSYSLLYYLLGYGVLAGVLLKRITNISKLMLLVFFCISMIFQHIQNVLILKLSYNVRGIMYLEDLVFSGYRSLFIIGATVFFVVLLKKTVLPKIKFVEIIGKNALGIYVLQDIVISLIGYYSNIAFVKLYIPVFVLFISTSLCYFLSRNKFTNWLISTKMSF